MGNDVDKLAERIADVEAPNSPRLVGRPIFDRKSGAHHTFKRCVDIVDFNRQIGRRRMGAALPSKADLDGHLFARAVSDDPAVIHQYFKSEYILVKDFGRLQIARIDIGNDYRFLYLGRNPVRKRLALLKDFTEPLSLPDARTL